MHDQLRYDRPAGAWTEALPLGNGRLGAMAFGGATTDRFQLNEDSAWSGSPATALGDPALAVDDGPGLLAETRRLIAAGDVHAASEVVKRLQRGHSQAYQPVGDLWIEDRSGRSAEARQYTRWLDLGTATAGHRWREADATVAQEALVSHRHQVLAVHRHSAGGDLDLDVRLTGAHPGYDVTNFEGVTVLSERMPSDVYPPHENVADPVIYDDAPGTSATVVTGMRVETDGDLSALPGGWSVRGATHVLVLVAIATDVDTTSPTPAPLHGDGELLANTVRATLEAARLPFEALRAAHVADHRELYGRVELDLPEAPDVQSLTTPARLERFARTGDDPALAALAFQFGRYLMICGSRPGTVPLNLQGIWNDAIRPPWSSNFTTNINLEMNYWAAHPANLSECAEPLSRWLARLAVSGATVARELYGARGWAAHHNSDVWGFAWPVGEGTLEPWHATWQLGSVWLSQSIWEDYAFTGDRERLRRSWPVLRGAVEFALDWLIPDGRGGLMTSPSTSPENSYLLPDGSRTALTVSSTADIALIRELLQQCLSAVEVLGVDEPGVVARVRDALPRLPGPRVMPDGRLAEWPTDVADAEPKHRHQTHLVGLFPGADLDVDAWPALARAAHASLAERGLESAGWSLAWRLALYARLREPRGAQALVTAFLQPVSDPQPPGGVAESGGVYPNLLCAHPPFQIDGNLGFVAGVVELLLQSHQGEIHLLPCLPADWPAGRARGLRARGGVEVAVEWHEGQLAQAQLRADRDTEVQVRWGGTTTRVFLPEGHTVCLGGDREA